jgi:tetratricopeptide (TPR) repeat protein
MPGHVDLLEAVRRRASVPAEGLRGLDGEWRRAEQAIAAELQSRPSSAAKLVASYGRLADVSGEREARGRAQRLAGSYLAYVGRHRDAAVRFRAAAGLLDGPAREHARLGLAVSSLRAGRFREAERICRAVRRVAESTGDRVLAAGAAFNAALAAHESGRPGHALEGYRRAAEAFAAAGLAQQAAVATENRANALVLLDRSDEALPLYDESAAAYEALGLAHEGARLRYNRGALLVAQDRLGAAERALADAERRFAAAGDSARACLARLDRGEALLRAGLVAEASRVLDSAARGLAREAPANERFRAKSLRARAAVLREDHAAVPRILGRAVAAERAWRADRHELAGLALAGRGRYAAARRTSRAPPPPTARRVPRRASARNSPPAGARSRAATSPRRGATRSPPRRREALWGCPASCTAPPPFAS